MKIFEDFPYLKQNSPVLRFKSSFLQKNTPASTKIVGGFGFSNSLWLLKYLKNVQNETTKYFLVGNTKLTF